MIPIIILSFATVLAGAWLLLLGKVTAEDWVTSAYCKVYDNMKLIKKLDAKDLRRGELLSRYSGAASVLSLVMRGDNTEKKRKLELRNERLQSGDLHSLSMLELPGYVLQREFEAIGKGSIHKMILEKSFELFGKKHAEKKTRNLLAKLLSYPMIGVALTLMLGAMTLGIGSKTAGAAILAIGSVLVLVLVYAMYDELCDLVKKRRRAICRQFPAVVSKLALLVTSGMIMDRAWKMTANSQELELYQEMRKASEELDNLVSPETAYGDFISRCNTKETTKLASAILQNLSKGNSEIGRLLKDMAHEAWQERRHMAKRDAEKANSRLMIPTMMLFLAILVMLMVPVVMNFSGL